MPLNIVVDSGFWFALFDERDSYHEEALELVTYIEDFNVLIPWPTLYETLNTRLVKRPERREAFKRFFEGSNVTKIDDTPYRDDSIIVVLNPLMGQEYSSVDYIIRQILEDTDIKTDALITFNARDFEDICYQKGIELLP
ncbi:type II toxin-antitoxin system VapC family toxin [Sulfurovum sp. AR]|uniref:type II toxin-antitoxin system VapC family toxin n=1 Tax=Sulfurovum sp. AR TaxID=1165841 RepID=UPI00025C4D47|nr:type II toxin-antitoxin system VapC family toxin [Sulfurovum sp. AR]EIF51387.1 hypothetical protein SULAR_04047 [Sulfurovum sp. AR]